jgi:hypothetical protein
MQHLRSLLRFLLSHLIVLHNAVVGLFCGWIVFPDVPGVPDVLAAISAELEGQSFGQRLAIGFIAVIAVSYLSATVVRLLPGATCAKMAVVFQAVGAATVAVSLMTAFYFFVTNPPSLFLHCPEDAKPWGLIGIAALFLGIVKVKCLFVYWQWKQLEDGQYTGGTGAEPVP